MPGWRAQSRGHGAERAHCCWGSVGVGSMGLWQKAPCRGGGIGEGLDARVEGSGAEGAVPAHEAAFPLLFSALPLSPSVRQEAGAGGSSAVGRECRSRAGEPAVPPPAPFSVSPVTETLRWQSRARRPWEGGGVCSSSARPPSIVSGGGGGTCSGRRRSGCSCPSRRSGDAAAVPGPQLAAGGRRCCLCLPGPVAASGNEHESARPRLLLHAQLLCKCCFLFPFSAPWKRGRKPAALSSSHAGGGILWICPGRRGIPFPHAGGHRSRSVLPWLGPRAQQCPAARAEPRQALVTVLGPAGSAACLELGDYRARAAEPRGAPRPLPGCGCAGPLRCYAGLRRGPALGAFCTFSERGFPALTLPADSPSTPPDAPGRMGSEGFRRAGC